VAAERDLEVHLRHRPSRSAAAHSSVGLGRRHAAVVFADLSGFTALVESAEPEDVYARVRPLIDELALLVAFHGGEIQQILGDGFMAVFGLRTEHEDAGEVSQAAVAAGIALVGAGAELSGRLPVHVGIESGELLVSQSWEPARYGVWGRTVTVAARLCDLAGPHTVNVGPHAFELGGRHVIDQLGAHIDTSAWARPKGFHREILVRSVTMPYRVPAETDQPRTRRPVTAAVAGS
jgi:class 3 adenylate cyclase